MLKRILVAIGDSVESNQILASGLTLVEKFGAEMMLLHAINPSSISNSFTPLVSGMFPIINEVAVKQYLKELKDYEQQGIEQLKEYAQVAKDRGIQAEISQNYGYPGLMICEVAKSWSADAIVMGRNQKSMMSEIFLGSTSNYVLHHAACSVMVVQLPAV
jgi:nucleotide-binding universal stress UspA family protein